MHRPAAGGRTSTIECLTRVTSLLAVLTSGPVAAQPWFTNEAQLIDIGALRVVAGIAVGEGSRAFGQFMAPGPVAATPPKQ